MKGSTNLSKIFFPPRTWIIEIKKKTTNGISSPDRDPLPLSRPFREPDTKHCKLTRMIIPAAQSIKSESAPTPPNVKGNNRDYWQPFRHIVHSSLYDDPSTLGFYVGCDFLQGVCFAHSNRVCRGRCGQEWRRRRWLLMTTSATFSFAASRFFLFFIWSGRAKLIVTLRGVSRE